MLYIMINDSEPGSARSKVCLFLLPLEGVVFVLPCLVEAAHGGFAHHDVSGLLETLEDVLLHVRHVVLGADGLELGRGLLVREH